MELATLITNIVIALTALAAAITTIAIYSNNKRDKWREASTILLSEMRQVINLLDIVKKDFNKNNFIVERRYLLEESSWNKYKYVILPKITLEQWNSLNKFFDAVELYDKAVTINDGFFDNIANQIWTNLHQHYRKVLEVNLNVKTKKDDIAELDDKIVKEITKFRDFYIVNNQYVGYSPLLPVNMAKEALESIDGNIITSSAGEALTKLTTR